MAECCHCRVRPSELHMFTCWNRVDGRRITMLARFGAGVLALVDAVVEGRERHDCREDAAVVRGVGDGLPLPPFPFLLLICRTSSSASCSCSWSPDVLIIPALVLVGPAVCGVP